LHAITTKKVLYISKGITSVIVCPLLIYRAFYFVCILQCQILFIKKNEKFIWNVKNVENIKNCEKKIDTITPNDFYEFCEDGKLVQKIQNNYSRQLDLEIENLVLKLYDISQEELGLITNELNNLPDLNAVNQMKIAIGELYV